MSSFKTFSENMLKAVFEEDRRGSAMVDLSELPSKYGFTGTRDRVQDWVEGHAGYLRFEMNPPPNTPGPLMARINGTGRLQAEQLYSDKDDVSPFFDASTGPATLEVQDAISPSSSDEVTITAREPVRVWSETWTGISAVRVDARNAQAISNLITSALDELGKVNNANVAQARTLLLAAKDLTEAPDPPSDLIWELIQRAGAVVGLIDIFIRIFSGLSA